MGSIGVRKSLRIVDNLEKILAIELLTAAQGFDFRKPLKSGFLIEETHKLIREHITFADTDRVFSDDIEKAISLIQSKDIMRHLHVAAKKHHTEFKNEDHELFGIY